MKELLRSYYNISNSIPIYEHDDKSCSFIFQDKKYFFLPFNRSEDEFPDLFSLNQELIEKGIPTAKFIPNKEKSFLNLCNNIKYVLLEMPLDTDKEYNVLDMNSYANKLVVSSKKSILYRNQWALLWSSKIDYFEYQVSQLGKDKTVILNSFSYYVGLAENAIAYVNSTTKKHQISINEKITLQRKRVTFPNTYYQYFNPLNYVIDIEVRDIASYFKSLFFNSYEDLWIEVNAYLKIRRLGIFGYQLLYARLLYPSFYFDIYEQVMDGKREEKDLLFIINRVDDYELFLKDMYFLISKYAPIEAVNWIINKKEL